MGRKGKLNMEIKYEIKGITLDVFDLIKIHTYYEAACTAEYLMENYDLTEEKAMKLGAVVRRYMDKFNVTEDEAITIDQLGEQLKNVDAPIVLIGDGTMVAYNKLKSIISNIRCAPVSIRYQSAQNVALIAAEKYNESSECVQTAHQVLPNYLRLSQAERELKKKNEKKG